MNFFVNSLMEFNAQDEVEANSIHIPFFLLKVARHLVSVVSQTASHSPSATATYSPPSLCESNQHLESTASSHDTRTSPVNLITANVSSHHRSKITIFLLRMILTLFGRMPPALLTDLSISAVSHPQLPSSADISSYYTEAWTEHVQVESQPTAAYAAPNIGAFIVEMFCLLSKVLADGVDDVVVESVEIMTAVCFLVFNLTLTFCSCENLPIVSKQPQSSRTVLSLRHRISMFLPRVSSLN